LSHKNGDKMVLNGQSDFKLSISINSALLRGVNSDILI